MNYSEMSDEQKADCHEFSRRRGLDLQNAAVTGQENAIKYIFLVNSGGTIAMLSFIAGIEQYRNETILLLMLGSFSLGLVSVGIVHVLRLYLFDNAFHGYKIDASSFYNGESDWSDFLNSDVERTDNSRLEWWIYFFGHLSFVFFITGVMLGFIFSICK